MVPKTDKQELKSERIFKFKYGQKPPLKDDRMRYIRQVLEGRFKCFAILDVYYWLIILSIILIIVFWYLK